MTNPLHRDDLERLDLSDHRGRPWRFDPRQDHSLVVVFIRGHWCPYCRRYLSKLAGRVDQLAERGARLVVISPEPAATSAALAQQLQMPFPILVDADGGAIRHFGVRNRFAGGASLLPHPAVFVFDPTGTLRFRSIDRNFRKRTTVRSILSTLDEIRGAAGLPGASSVA